MDEDQSSDMASSNRKNIKRLLSWSSGSSSTTASENEDESKLGWVKRNVIAKKLGMHILV